MVHTLKGIDKNKNHMYIVQLNPMPVLFTELVLPDPAWTTYWRWYQEVGMEK